MLQQRQRIRFGDESLAFQGGEVGYNAALSDLPAQ
jgi:hypothetical protein